MKNSKPDSKVSNVWIVGLYFAASILLFSCELFSPSTILIETDPLSEKFLQKELENKQELIDALNVEIKVLSEENTSTNNETENFIQKLYTYLTKKSTDIYVGFNKAAYTEIQSHSTDKKIHIVIPYIKDSLVFIKNAKSKIPDNFTSQNLYEIFRGNSTITLKNKNQGSTSVNLKFYIPEELSHISDFNGKGTHSLPNEYSVFIQSMANSIYLNSYTTEGRTLEILTKEHNAILIVNLSYYVYLLEHTLLDNGVETQIITIMGAAPSTTLPSPEDINNNIFNITLNPNYPYHTTMYIIINQKSLYRKSVIKLLKTIFLNEHIYLKSNYIYRDEPQILDSKRQLDKNFQLYQRIPLFKSKKQGDVF